MIYQILSLLATPVLADEYGLKVTADAAELSKFGDNLPTFIGNTLGTALSLVGVLFFALMLYGGITWMMAHGNAESEKKALSTITAAIIGILIVLGSYALTNFVLGSVKSAGNTKQQADKVLSDKAVVKKCVAKPEKELQKICDNWFIEAGDECPAGPLFCEAIVENKKCTSLKIDWLMVKEICGAEIENTCLDSVDHICEWK